MSVASLTAKIRKLKALKQEKAELRKLRKPVPPPKFGFDWDGSNTGNVAIASPKFKALLEPSRYKVYYGGRGGAKSRTFARVLLILGTQKKLRILCAREVQLSIKDSVKRILDDEIQRLGLGGFYTSLKAEINGSNGSEFYFAGLRAQSVEQVKSFEGIDIVWVEEAQSLSSHSIDILIPTIRKPGSELWFSFNPRYKEDAVYDMFVGGEPPPKSIVVKINYDDNRFFPEVLDDERQWLQRRDVEKYNHVWLGDIITLSEARIFKNWEIKEFETPINAQIFLGLDFGLQVDPSCVVGCWFDDAKRNLYIDRESYEHTTDISQLPALLARCPGTDRNIITFDSSRPELGRELQKHGYRMKPSRKGAGSVLEGIEYLQGWSIFVHPRCKNAIYELSHYSYKVDKHTGQVIQPAIPQDKSNHVIDSLRYSVESRWMQNKTDWIKRLNS